VRFIVSSCGIGEKVSSDAFCVEKLKGEASSFNEAHPEIEVQVESIPACWGDEGWAPKVLSQIQEKKLEWCGMMVMFPFIEIAAWAKSGIHVAMEDYIAASKEPGADTMLEDMFPFALEDAKYQDHIYGIPFCFDAQTFNYQKRLYDAAGWQKPPETWEELHSACADFKTVHEAEGKLAYAWAPSLRSSLQPYVYSATEKPYTEDGLLDFMGAGVECLEFMRSLVEAGFTPRHGSDSWWELLAYANLGAALADFFVSRWIPWELGEAGMPVSPQSKVKGGGAGIFFNTECSSLFQSAPYPQELVDFLVWTLGPANTAMQTWIVTQMDRIPVYQSVYDEILARDPLQADYTSWVKYIRDVAAGSVMAPRNEYWPAEAAAYEKWAPQFFEEGSELTAEETAQKMLDEVKGEIAKMG